MCPGAKLEAELPEQAQHGVIRVRLHRVAGGETEGVREREHAAGRVLERGAVVDVARGPEAVAHRRSLRGRQEHGAHDRRLVRD
jgi:hypothetical protein